jgi:hypothetical protein
VTITSIPPTIGVINQSGSVRDDELALIVAAIQKGVNRDFAPQWHASVAIHVLKHPPRGWWKCYIKDGLDQPGAAGYHTDVHNQPVLEIDAQAGELSITIDHEVKETLADPFGSRLIPMTMHGKRVEVLAEVCDPCESAKFAYKVDGVPVSDFVLPPYYNDQPHHRRTGHISDLLPGMIAQEGYISYLDEGVWKQDTWFSGGSPQTQTLGRHEDIAQEGETPRETIDRLTAIARAEA